MRERRIRRVAIVVGGLAAIGGIGFLLFRPGPEVEGVQKPPDQGRAHVANPTYRTATPTSGPHLPGAPACGSYSAPLGLGSAVHALEHGAVVVWYRSSMAEELEEPLLDMLDRWDSHVIVSPNDDLEAPIVATSWNRLKEYTRPADVVEFVETYRGRGPEDIPCDY